MKNSIVKLPLTAALTLAALFTFAPGVSHASPRNVPTPPRYVPTTFVPNGTLVATYLPPPPVRIVPAPTRQQLRRERFEQKLARERSAYQARWGANRGRMNAFDRQQARERRDFDRRPAQRRESPARRG